MSGKEDGKPPATRSGPVFAWLDSRSYAIYRVHAPIYDAASPLICFATIPPPRI